MNVLLGDTAPDFTADTTEGPSSATSRDARRARGATLGQPEWWAGALGRQQT
jgi:hypothetical protein